MQRAKLLFEQRRFEEAAIEARKASDATPNSLAAWKLSGLSLQLAGQMGEAEKVLSLAIERFPADADLLFYYARVLYLQSSLVAAEKVARRAIAIQPDHPGAHAQLAMTLEGRNDFAGALQHYRRGIELIERTPHPPTLPFVYAGNLLMKMQQYEEALKLFSRATAIAPKSGEIALSRGKALEKLGRGNEAEEEYRRAISLDGNPQARNALDRLRAGVAGTARQTVPASDLPPIRFREAAVTAGLGFTLRNDASTRKYQVETMTGGVGVIDFDGDGWQDIYFVNGAELPAMKKSSPQYLNRLYRNNQDGTFRDVTEAAGVAGEGYSMGVAVGDYDNDGDADLFVAGVNRNFLFRNLTAEGKKGRFEEVTEKSSLVNRSLWSVAAAWIDYDNDGDLDLFVVNYCKWHPEIDPYCGAMKEGWRTYCYPDRYEGLSNQLFKNNGDGTFVDSSSQSGVSRHIGKGMGVAIADYDDDGWMDIFVANDTMQNFLFRNNSRGGFEEVALSAGVAVNDSGKPVSGMGVDFRDADNDGLPDLILSALEGETFPFFRNLGKGFFGDLTWQSGLGAETVKRSGWSLGLFDFNNDGWKDLFTANAHVNDNIELYNNQTYRQANSLYANFGQGFYRDVSGDAGREFQTKRAHRGSAFADFNNDGRVDIVTTSLNEPAELFLNESPGESHWLSLRLHGTRSNRDGIGAKIKVVTGAGRILHNHVTSSVGYASASDLRVHFGLGRDTTVKEIEIRWPSRYVQRLFQVGIDRVLMVREGAGPESK